jgi:hypothetical protein
VYTSRRGFSGGLGSYGLSANFERRLPLGGPGSGLAAGAEVLGPGETLEECPQPVSTAERDSLLNEIKGWTSPYAGAHYHENHPDLKAIFTDVVNRLRGLEGRPKLLRCDKEGRDRARIWIKQLEDLRRRVEKRGTTGPAGCTATTWVHVTEPFQFTVFRGPTYTVRPGSTRPDCFKSGQGAAPAPGPIVSSAPPGSVVVGGVVYPSSAAAAAAQPPAPGSSSMPPEITSVTPAPTTTAPTSDGFPSLLPDLEGSVAGIPTKYLVYGAGALFAWRMLKGK